MKKAIIRFTAQLYPEEMQAIANRIRKEWEETGMVLVSPLCEVYVVDEAEIEGEENDPLDQRGRGQCAARNCTPDGCKHCAGWEPFGGES